MKKLISILAALAVVTTCSVVGFAADFEVPADLETVTKYEKATEGEDAGLYVVPLADVANGQAQTTILAVKGDTISVGSIEYIGQSADTTFKFDLRNTLAAGETVYVLAGGSDITAQVVGYMAEAAAEPVPTTFTISGKVVGYYKTAPSVTLTSKEDASKVYNVALNSDGTFAQVVDAGTYKFEAKKDYSTSYIINTIDASANNVSYATDIGVYPGNVNNDRALNGNDLGLIVDHIGKNATTYKVYNINEDRAINGNDLGVMIDNIGKPKTVTISEIIK